MNRTRIWIICFNLDKSTATQFGKPSTLKEDYCSAFILFVGISPLPRLLIVGD
jgi:hypothetical protein